VFPNEDGYYGEFGGRFVPETLIPTLNELTAFYYNLKHDTAFKEDWSII
jgi:tryptophan synthase beta chain